MQALRIRKVRPRVSSWFLLGGGLIYFEVCIVTRVFNSVSTHAQGRQRTKFYCYVIIKMVTDS